MIEKVLVVVEHKNDVPRKVCLEILDYWAKAAADKDLQVQAIVLGEEIPYTLYEQIAATGVSDILSYEQEGINTYNPEIVVPLLAETIKNYTPDLIMLGNTAMGKDIAPRLAQAFDADMVSDIVTINYAAEKLNFVRTTYGGKVLELVDYKSSPLFVTVRPNVLGVEEPLGNPEPRVTSLDYAKRESRTYTVLEVLEKEYKTKPLIEAERIVCGGRGIQQAESFDILQELADILDASVATSRMPVDLGWVPRDMLIGQSGKTVRPKLYMGFGVAGEIQHLAGMATASYIVAVNKNPAARIFDVANFGIVGDFFQVIPEIIKEIRRVMEE